MMQTNTISISLSSALNDAKWHYEHSLELFEKAWFDSAITHLDKAISLDPSCSLYKEVRAQFMARYNPYRDPYYNTPRYRRRGCCPCCCCGGDSTCDCCCQLFCLDSCCECMGGDLITCI
jgi:hypothetical protein